MPLLIQSVTTKLQAFLEMPRILAQDTQVKDRLRTEKIGNEDVQSLKRRLSRPNKEREGHPAGPVSTFVKPGHHNAICTNDQEHFVQPKRLAHTIFENTIQHVHRRMEMLLVRRSTRERRLQA